MRGSEGISIVDCFSLLVAQVTMYKPAIIKEPPSTLHKMIHISIYT